MEYMHAMSVDVDRIKKGIRTNLLWERIPKPKILHRSPQKHSRQEQCTYRPGLLRVKRLYRLTNRRRAEDLGQKLMQLGPERLRVGEEGVEAGDGGRTPKIRGSPSISLEFWGCLDGEGDWA